MSCSLNSLKGGYVGDYIGDYYIGVIKGDARSLDYGSYVDEPDAISRDLADILFRVCGFFIGFRLASSMWVLICL